MYVFVWSVYVRWCMCFDYYFCFCLSVNVLTGYADTFAQTGPRTQSQVTNFPRHHVPVDFSDFPKEHRSSWCSRRVGSRHSQLACCSTDSVEAHDASSLAVGPDKSRIATVGCSFAKVTIVDSLVFDSEELLCVLRPRCCPREEPAMLAGAVFRFATCGSRLQGST